MLRQPVGLACRQVDTQPIAYFLANGGTTNAVDLDIIPNSWTGHEIFLVGLAALNTPRFKGTIATEGQSFQSCPIVSPGRAFKGALLKRKRRSLSHRRSWIRVQASANQFDLSASGTIPLDSSEACEVQAIALGVNTKSRGFLRGLLHVTFFLSSGRYRCRR